jgi:hypothetical protein
MAQVGPHEDPPVVLIVKVMNLGDPFFFCFIYETRVLFYNNSSYTSLRLDQNNRYSPSVHKRNNVPDIGMVPAIKTSNSGRRK